LQSVGFGEMADIFIPVEISLEEKSGVKVLVAGRGVRDGFI